MDPTNPNIDPPHLGPVVVEAAATSRKASAALRLHDGSGSERAATTTSRIAACDEQEGVQTLPAMHQVDAQELGVRFDRWIRLAGQGQDVAVHKEGRRLAVIVGFDRYLELCRKPEPDWRMAMRDWLSKGEGISSRAFRKLLAEAKRPRR